MVGVPVRHHRRRRQHRTAERAQTLQPAEPIDAEPQDLPVRAGRGRHRLRDHRRGVEEQLQLVTATEQVRRHVQIADQILAVDRARRHEQRSGQTVRARARPARERDRAARAELRSSIGVDLDYLEITEDMDEVTLGLLVRELDVTDQEVYRLPAPLDLGGLFDISRIDRPDLHFAKHVPTTAVQLMPAEPQAQPDVFAAISRGDILLHHPYESFATSVQAFLEQAAADPHVLAIKQTLYRTSGDSPIVEALIDAAESGKQVLALVEIKARFDEQANISWARKLEKAGVHVVYGLVGLKTHCKLALVVRQEKGVLRHYSHIGTGNYNPKTSRIYEDLGLLTADAQVGKDLTRLFNELSGYAIEKKFKRLLVAPLHLRKALLKRIGDETAAALEGRPAGIRIKVNSMVDEAIIDALYRASQAGVQVEVWVRGICSLKPGVAGMSENISVRSILGRYLEHSRIFSFHNDGDPQVFIGSADMMHRNLDRRVEALVRLVAPEHLAEIDALFARAMDDRTSSWWLSETGEWTRHDRDDSDHLLDDMQDRLMQQIGHRKRVAIRR